MTIKTHGRMFTDNTVGITQLALSDGTDGQAIVTDGSGTLRFATVGAGGSVGSSVYVEDIRTGDGTTATFTLSTAAPYEESILVFIDGVAQPTSSFVLPSTTSITFSPAPGNGAAIRICHLGIASSLADCAVTGAKICMGGDTAGDVIYYNGSSYQRLGIGTALQILATNSAANAPEWINAATASLPAVGADGNVLTSDGTNWNSETPLGGVGGELVSIQTIEATTPGASQTWTRPSGVKRIEVHIVGAGGYGQGNIAGGNSSSGGGAGGYCVGVYDVTNLATATVIVGISGDAAGQMNSSFAGTGITTLAAGGGGFSDGTNSYPSTSAGGTASGGMLNFVGEQGTLAHGGGHARFGGEYGDGVDPVSGNTKLMGKNGYCYIKEYSDASASLVGTSLVSTQLFTSTGNNSNPQTWTRPANITKIEVWVVGRGGNSSGGGGGGGGTAYSVLDVTNLASATITVPVAGTTTFAGSGITTLNGNAGGDAPSGGAGIAGPATGGQINIAGTGGGTGTGSVGGDSHFGGTYGAGALGAGAGNTPTTPAVAGCVYIKEYSDPSLVGGLFGTITEQILTHNDSDTTPRTGTWIKPAGVKQIEVEVVGGGGAGGANSGATPGGNGGPSGFAERIFDVRNIDSMDWSIGLGQRTGVTASSSYFGQNGTLATTGTGSTSLTVTVVGGAVTAIATGVLTGAGLTIPPQIIIEPDSTHATGRDGTGATAVATIAGGVVTGITITNGGSGYVTGAVRAWYGIGATFGATGATGGNYSPAQDGVGWGVLGNWLPNKTGSSKLSGSGAGGTGAPGGGGNVGNGSHGAIYIREYR